MLEKEKQDKIQEVKAIVFLQKLEGDVYKIPSKEEILRKRFLNYSPEKQKKYLELFPEKAKNLAKNKESL